jgi:hypothetical protein
MVNTVTKQAGTYTSFESGSPGRPWASVSESCRHFVCLVRHLCNFMRITNLPRFSIFHIVMEKRWKLLRCQKELSLPSQLENEAWKKQEDLHPKGGMYQMRRDGASSDPFPCSGLSFRSVVVQPGFP